MADAVQWLVFGKVPRIHQRRQAARLCGTHVDLARARTAATVRGTRWVQPGAASGLVISNPYGVDWIMGNSLGIASSVDGRKRHTAIGDIEEWLVCQVHLASRSTGYRLGEWHDLIRSYGSPAI